MSAPATFSAPPAPAPAPTSTNPATDLKPTSPASAAVKPCCVCKDEKAARDECMLFSSSNEPERGECVGMVDRYRDCMRGFGFAV